MRKFFLILSWILCRNEVYPQENLLYQTGLTAEQNLKAIGSLVLYTTGGVGFDTRYEGIKGSPRLFDTLLPSFLNVRGQDYYIQLNADIDLIHNSLVFYYPKTGKVLTLLWDKVGEVKINRDGKEMIFRTPPGKIISKEFKEHKFFQVLKEGQFQFIKIPIKKLIPADYKDVYSADRRYDQYAMYYKYYIRGPDSSFHQIQLTRKSLLKVFPDRKELINNSAESKSYENNEDMVLDVLGKF